MSTITIDVFGAAKQVCEGVLAFGQATAKLPKESANLKQLGKLCDQVYRWVAKVAGSASPALRALGNHGKMVASGVALTEWMTKVPSVEARSYSVFAPKTDGTIAQWEVVAAKISECIDWMVGLDEVYRYAAGLGLVASFAPVVILVNLARLFFSSFSIAQESAKLINGKVITVKEDVAGTKTATEMNLKDKDRVMGMIRIAMQVAFITLALITLAGAMSLVVIGQDTLILSLVTFTTLCSLTNYYIKELA